VIYPSTRSCYRKISGFGSKKESSMTKCAFAVALVLLAASAVAVRSFTHVCTFSINQCRTTRAVQSQSLGDEKPVETIRVRIWRALASGEELSLIELAKAVGESRRLSDLKSHLVHVEKQAKTLKNKSSEWRERRGISQDVRKNMRLKKTRVKKEIHFRLECTKSR
jgi:hypothetical protein